MNNSSSSERETKTEEPVTNFPLKFTWHTGDWEAIFDAQIELLKSDVARARADGRIVLYLSCPISSRGGGWSGTNVDIAKHAERAILDKWGDGFWILNPAQYQLESKAGTGLMVSHANRLGINLESLLQNGGPSGGDYMRMWTKVLVEDDSGNIGGNFSGFYFLGPSDVHSFFTPSSPQSLTAGIQTYFARKMETDISFRRRFHVSTIFENGQDSTQDSRSQNDQDPEVLWIQRRAEFLRFYGLKASANFSLGCHDEWLILQKLNLLRRQRSANEDMIEGDVGDQIAAFFDGKQVSMSSTEATVSNGYAK